MEWIMMLCPTHRDDRRIASQSVGICGTCLRKMTDVPRLIMRSHEASRLQAGLVPAVPEKGTIVCAECGNHCRMDEGETGFCNLRQAKNGEAVHRFGERAIVSWYFDPLPTNCVADWVCGFRESYAASGRRAGLKNLAVFYGSCNSDCLFCQNASYQRMMARGEPLMTAEELAAVADDRTACVCYFGGDPACNPEHSLRVSEILHDEWGMKVCYETNGNISNKWLGRIADVVGRTEGTLKFDLKAITPSLYTALTGVSNRLVLENFKRIAAIKGYQKPTLVASLLLLPGYIDLTEIRTLCEFIATCSPEIPTALLGFQPKHLMTDLPRTSRAHAQAALEAAHEAGLSNVRVGNLGLLGEDKYRFD
jgi:pyruvate formate lyase activating enzyme